MTAAPEVSVVIAAFNAEATLGDQLAALSRQRVSFPFEVLVCDNGSTDGTAALALSWADRVPVRVVDASVRRGPGAARNAGAAVARGEFLVFCDADDVVADGWLGAMHTALQTDDFVAGTCRKAHRNVPRGESTDHYYTYSLYRVAFFPQLPSAGAGNLGVRTDLFRAVGGFDDIFRTAEDDDLCWRIQLSGHRLVGNSEAVITVMNRPTLRAMFAQGYSHRAGERVLRHKYAKVIEAFRGLEPTPFVYGATGSGESWTDAAPRPRQSVLTFIRRAVRKLFRIRRAADFANIVYRVGEAFGSRFGSIDRSQAQLDAPASPQDLLARARG